MSSPRVSVVMSIYKEAELLPAAIESVLKQTFRDFEFIIISDGASEDCQQIARSYAEKDSRIHLIHQNNQGLTIALIRACKEARGEFIARQDADDWSAPDRFNEQIRLLDSDPSLGLVSSWFDLVGPEAELLNTIKGSRDPKVATHELREGRKIPGHGSLMFRKSLYEECGGYRSEFYFVQDWDLWFRMAERMTIAYVPKVLYRHLLHTKSITGSLHHLQKEFGVLGQECRIAREKGQPEAPFLEKAGELRTEIIKRCKSEVNHKSTSADTLYLIGSQLISRGNVKGVKYLLRLLRYRPWDLRVWARLAQSLWICWPQVSKLMQREG